jgi:hypothetical protein
MISIEFTQKNWGLLRTWPVSCWEFRSLPGFPVELSSPTVRTLARIRHPLAESAFPRRMETARAAREIQLSRGEIHRILTAHSRGERPKRRNTLQQWEWRPIERLTLMGGNWNDHYCLSTISREMHQRETRLRSARPCLGHGIRMIAKTSFSRQFVQRESRSRRFSWAMVLSAF